MKWIGSGIFAIILGLSSKFVLVGTNSPQALILLGVTLIIFGYIRLICSEAKVSKKLHQKRRISWRIALVTVFGFFALLGIFLMTGFSVATLVRGEIIRGEMIHGIIAGTIMSIPLAPSILILKKAIQGNKVVIENKE
jgi:hypothetical protein